MKNLISIFRKSASVFRSGSYFFSIIYIVFLILVSLSFIAVKFYMPITFDGSFIDEYRHIFSGLDFFLEGSFPRFYAEEAPYKRGSYTSIVAGAFLLVFGKSIFVAKMVPAFVGLINFFLLFYVSKNTINDRKYVILLLVVYTLSPWVIFNHFYLRLYVFYELFILLLLAFAHKLLLSIENNKWKYFILYLLFIAGLNLLNSLGSHDPGKNILTLSTALLLFHVFVFDIQRMSFPQDNRLGAILNKICSLHKILKIILVLIISSYVYYSFDLHEKTSYLLNGSTEYAGEEERYEEFFFHQNYLFTALFCLTTASLFVLKTSFQRIVTMVGGALFIMHIVSSEDLQIIRGVLYFMPIFYLVSLMSFNQVKYCSTKVFFLVISMLFVYTIKSSYTEELLEYPHIPKEIHYIEYQKLYSTVKKTCNNDEIIIEASPSAFISGFYNVDIDYLLVSTKHIESNNYYFDDSTSTYKTVYQNVPILEEFSDIMKMDRDVCLIARSPTLRRFISRRKYYHLKKKFKYKSYKNLDLFYIPTNR